jgi:chorismate synthase
MSTFGKLFKVTTFGESHGKGVGCIIEGVPPLMKIEEKDIQYQLNRRKPNQNSLLSARNEPDTVEIYSGIQEGVTLGTPISLIVKNIDIKPSDYKSFSNIPRPGHADFTYLTKYGVKSSSGGGRASARETVARVAAGAVAEKYLSLKYETEIVSFVSSIGHIEIPKKDIKNYFNTSKKEIDDLGSFMVYKCNNNTNIDSSDNINDKETEKNIDSNKIEILRNKFLDRFFIIKDENTDLFDFEEKVDEIFKKDNDDKDKDTENNHHISFNDDECIVFNNNKYLYNETINIRCPHPETTVKMIQLIKKVKDDQDSIGGIATCIIKNCPQSLGEPCFDKFEADLAKAMLSIPATKGFEIGSGFEGTKMR